MTVEGTKEEIKLNTEILKFLLIVLLATSGGMVTLFNLEKQNHVQEVLVFLGATIMVLLLLGIAGLILYIYSLLKRI